MVKKIEVKVSDNGLEMISVCANCYAIKEQQTPDSDWFKEEDPVASAELVRDYSNGDKNKGLSHGICPPCMRKLYPEYVD